jgi:hypothetical protein
VEFLTSRPAAAARSIGDLLFPDGEPPLPDEVAANGERMNVAYVVGVLMGNRDVRRRVGRFGGVAA